MADLMDEVGLIKNSPVLNLIYKLCDALKRENINYCHWKSNAALDRSASGENDLDLLIGREHIQHFTEILSRFNFKEARQLPDKELPGVLNYYGYDEESGKLVHVHAHYQLIMGDDTTKNFRLPIEKAFLASSVQNELFKVPSPEFEFIVLIVRMMLKHSTWDALLSFHATLSRTEKQEIAYLLERIDKEKLNDIMARDLPFFELSLFDKCLESLQSTGSVFTRYMLGRHFHRTLQAHSRRSSMPDTFLKVWRRFMWGVRRHVFNRPKRKYLANGGMIIALVGGDGSGKSTAVDELYRFLSRNFVTTKVHLGKPRWSLSTFFIKGILRVGRFLGLFSNENISVQPTAGKPAAKPSYSWLLWHVFTARDRYRAYIRARRFSTNGGIVICDRFPMPQIKMMDGPKTGQIINICKTGALKKFLIQKEEKFYQHMLLPDLVVIMKVDPEIAVQRRADEDAVWIRNRSREIWELDWKDAPVNIIDAGQPKDEMLATLKSLVWANL
jgi:thymidylate kinase